MKILFLSNSIGGLRCFRYELINKLIQRKDAVYIGSNIEESTSLFSALGCQIYSTPMDLRGTHLFADIKLILRYLWIFIKIKPDIVLSYTIKPNVYGGLVCRILKIKQISSITGLGTAFDRGGIITRIAIWLYRIGIKKNQFVFFQNQESIDIFNKYKIAPKSQKILVAGSGVNLEKYCFLEYPQESANIQFLFIGKTRKEKGIDLYLEAATRLKKKYPQCIFNIVGACEENYQDRINLLQKQGIIVYHNYQKNVIPFIQMCHCNILPSFHEGMSNSLLESSACGRPAITTNISGCREIIENNQSGFLIVPGDINDLISKIEKFINLSYNDKKEMGYAARKYVEKKFDRHLVVQKYIEKIDS